MKFLVLDRGVERTITRFLFLPRKIGQEVRWLEKAQILQRNYEGWWIDVRFVDNKISR